MTLAKGLAGGVPIGAMLANEEVARGFEPGTHASTFGGNPLASAAALYVQQAIDELGLLEHCREMGAYLGSALLRLAERRRPRTRGARGRGLLQGLVVDGDPADDRRAGARPRAAAVGGRRQRGALRAAADRRQSRDRRGDRNPRPRARRGEVGDDRVGEPTTGKDFLSFWDLPDGGIEALIRRAEELRGLRAAGTPHATRPGRVLGMVFEKASTRTRASFEIAMYELGGHASTSGCRARSSAAASRCATPRACSRATATRSWCGPSARSAPRSWRATPRCR